MSDFAVTWRLSRGRFDEALAGLTQRQLTWRLHPGTLSLGQMALHVAGVEVSFSSQLTGAQLDDFASRVKACATDGVVNDRPFPFRDEELSPELIERALELGRASVAPLIEAPTDAVRAKRIISALGPEIDGTGALARLSFHSAYHQGQAHLLRSAPDFPPD
jgi:hypothetical protein